MINITLTPAQRQAVRRQRARPFKFLLQEPFDFDRVYAYSCWVDATILRLIHPTARSVIDIGCGQAGVAAVQNIIYGMEIYLIDGHRDGERDGGYADAGSMNHYSTWSDLPETLTRWGCDMSRVHFVSIAAAATFDWPTVDLVQSTLSCGTHYPLSTYDWLYARVNHSNTRYCFTMTGTDPVDVPLEFRAEQSVPCMNHPGNHYHVFGRN